MKRSTLSAPRSDESGGDAPDGKGDNAGRRHDYPAIVKRLKGGDYSITIHEGRKHQVRRMFEAMGYTVKSLNASGWAICSLVRWQPARSGSSGRMRWMG